MIEHLHIGTAFAVLSGKVGLGKGRYRGNEAKAPIFLDFSHPGRE